MALHSEQRKKLRAPYDLERQIAQVKLRWENTPEKFTAALAQLPQVQTWRARFQHLKEETERLQANHRSTISFDVLAIKKRIEANLVEMQRIKDDLGECIKFYEDQNLYLHLVAIRKEQARKRKDRIAYRNTEYVGYGKLQQTASIWSNDVSHYQAVYGMRDWLLGATLEQLRHQYGKSKTSYHVLFTGLINWILKRCRDSGLVEDFYLGGEFDNTIGAQGQTVLDDETLEKEIKDIRPNTRQELLSELNFWLFQLDKQARLWNLAAPPTGAEVIHPELTTAEKMEQRNQEIFELVVSGVSTKEVTMRYQISKERVRQIFNQQLRSLRRFFSTEERATLKTDLDSIRQNKEIWLQKLALSRNASR